MKYGPVAQLGERRVRNAEVESSILFGSTKIFDIKRYHAAKTAWYQHFWVIDPQST